MILKKYYNINSHFSVQYTQQSLHIPYLIYLAHKKGDNSIGCGSRWVILITTQPSHCFGISDFMHPATTWSLDPFSLFFLLHG
jgi:hypothetical protein